MKKNRSSEQCIKKMFYHKKSNRNHTKISHTAITIFLRWDSYIKKGFWLQKKNTFTKNPFFFHIKLRKKKIVQHNFFEKKKSNFFFRRWRKKNRLFFSGVFFDIDGFWSILTETPRMDYFFKNSSILYFTLTFFWKSS